MDNERHQIHSEEMTPPILYCGMIYWKSYVPAKRSELNEFAEFKAWKALAINVEGIKEHGGGADDSPANSISSIKKSFWVSWPAGNYGWTASAVPDFHDDDELLKELCWFRCPLIAGALAILMDMHIQFFPFVIDTFILRFADGPELFWRPEYVYRAIALALIASGKDASWLRSLIPPGVQLYWPTKVQEHLLKGAAIVLKHEKYLQASDHLKDFITSWTMEQLLARQMILCV